MTEYDTIYLNVTNEGSNLPKIAETKDSSVHKASRIHSGSREETVDRISELPVHIIHQILSKLYQKEAARTVVLSKKWYYCWTSRPNIVFNQLQRMPLEKFVKLVDQTLQPHLEQNLRIEEFNLQYHDAGLAPSHIDKWIDSVVKLDVKVLKIDTLDNSVTSSPSSLPDVIYSAKNLTALKLIKCKFELTNATNIRFCFLKDLYLSFVHISQGQLERVLDRCPFIANLSLSLCNGINKLHVFDGLVHLEYLCVASCELDSVIVHAPNLMNLTLIQGRGLEEVEIQAPNLLEFIFRGDKLPFLSTDPSYLENARLNFYLFETDVDSVWCTKLQHFLQNFSYSKGLILVICCIRTKSILMYEDPREIVTPPSPHVNIFIAPMSRVESIIDTLMCKPKIISVLPCTNSKLLEVLPELNWCRKKQKSGKDCSFNVECYYCQRELKEVSNFLDISDEETASWYSWLNSTLLIDRVTTFSFNA